MSDFEGICRTALAAVLLVLSAQASTIVVCPQGCNHTTIQSAIDSSLSGDVIEVLNGTYQEHVYVHRRGITLIGEGGDRRPVVDANGSGSAITISSAGVTLDGFGVTNSGHCGCGNAGIKITSENNTVTHNMAYGNKYGIYVSGSNNSIFGNGLFENDINAMDSGNNTWDLGRPDFIRHLLGKAGLAGAGGNHYDDYDEPSEGCLDENGNGFCDEALNISGGSSVDRYPILSL